MFKQFTQKRKTETIMVVRRGDTTTESKDQVTEHVNWKKETSLTTE